MQKTLCRFILLCFLSLVASACATSTTTKPENATSQKLFPQQVPARYFPSGFPPTKTAFAHTLLFGSGVPATTTDFLTRARQADYILIGERHTSPTHHEAQAAIIALLAENGLSPAVGLEMVPAKLQPRLDRFNSRQTTIDELPTLLDWATVWGFDFALYEPVFRKAEQYNIPVYGLNVSPGVIQSIRKHDTPAKISADEQQELPPVIEYPTAMQRDKLSRFFKQHASMLMARKDPEGSKKPAQKKPSQKKLSQKKPSQKKPAQKSSVAEKLSPKNPTVSNPAKRPAPNHGAKALQRFITIQSLWDSAMGYNATRIDHPGPKVILAGGAHVEYGHGIAHRIRHYEPEATILIIMPLASLEKTQAGQADFYYLKKR